MKLLVIDTDTVGLDFCLRCAAWGHEVRWCIPKEKDKTPSRAGDGMGLKKVEDWREHIEWADLITPTMNDIYVHALEPYRKAGFPIFGPSLESRRLEVDREFGQEAMERHGIAVPEYRTFTDYDQAIAYVKKMDEAFASKPLGNNPDKSLTYVAKSPEDLCWKLASWKDQGKKLNKFMLQKKVEGQEFGVSCWMGRDGFIGRPNENFEFKKLMPGDMGVNTGETGTVMKYVEKSKLFDMVLKPLEKYLRQIGHTGDVDISTIVDDKGVPNILEWTTRRGWPADFLFQSLHDAWDPCQWMLDALHGKDTLRFSRDHIVGFLMWIPDFPRSHLTQKEVEGIPIFGVTEKLMPQIHFCSVMWEVPLGLEEEQFCTTGDYVLVVDGKGHTVKVARDRALAVLEKIEIPNDPAWREDIGDARLAKKIAKLQKLGFATEFTYQ